MRVPVDTGIDVQYPNGHTEHVNCTEWWVSDGVLHTDGKKVASGPHSYRRGRGPSFSLANVKKWEETR